MSGMLDCTRLLQIIQSGIVWASVKEVVAWQLKIDFHFHGRLQHTHTRIAVQGSKSIDLQSEVFVCLQVASV